MSSVGRNTEILLRMQICGLPHSFVRALSLWVVGSLACSWLVVNDTVLIMDSVLLGIGELVIEALELEVLGLNVLDGGKLQGGSGEEVLDVGDDGVIPGWGKALSGKE